MLLRRKPNSGGDLLDVIDAVRQPEEVESDGQALSYIIRP
jgi:hypothetical protein